MWNMSVTQTDCTWAMTYRVTENSHVTWADTRLDYCPQIPSSSRPLPSYSSSPDTQHRPVQPFGNPSQLNTVNDALGGGDFVSSGGRWQVDGVSPGSTTLESSFGSGTS